MARKRSINSETVAFFEGDAPPAFGAKLRLARHRMGLTMSDVAAKVGCSESMISKIENDVSLPSLQTLHRLVSALDLNIANLMRNGGYEPQFVGRAGERPVLVVNPAKDGRGGLKLEALSGEWSSLQANIHIVAPGGGSDGAIQHDGEEVGYVLAGELELSVGDRHFRLKAGDSFCFPSDHPHAYRNPGIVETRVFWVNSPATF